ncbi:MAG: hypothetical protein EOP10_22270 [Proteobacteria bacterium]|nr:MAG: hypothetical protein EOP10_22270 [Pseudomonadota bacterium]
MNTFLLLSLGLSTLLMACGPSTKAPTMPTSVAITVGGGNAAPETETTPPAEEAPITTEPFNATVAHRLSALPAQVRDQVKLCEDGGHFYNLGDQACTALVPATVVCSINDEFKAKLDPTTVAPLDEYLATKAVKHRLYGCTEDAVNFTLHFYLFEAGTVNYKKLNIAKKPG